MRKRNEGKRRVFGIRRAFDGKSLNRQGLNRKVRSPRKSLRKSL